MKLTNLRPIKSTILSAVQLTLALGWSFVIYAQPTNPPGAEVTRSDSAMVRDRQVYSVRFPGGNTLSFFNFLASNGFSADSVLISAEAKSVPLMPFTVHRVSLRELARSLEFVSRDQLKVEIVEKGESADANIWYVKRDDRLSPTVRTKALAVVSLLAMGDGRKRIHQILEQVERMLADITAERPELGRRSFNLLEAEKIVVVVGPEMYVEALISALEAAEKAAPEPLWKRKQN